MAKTAKTNADCKFSSPLKRDGTSQRQRMLAALNPSYARIDERELGDFLVQAHRYATLLRYYSKDNTPGGDWVDFIQNDVSSLVALVGATDSESIRKEFAEKKAISERVSDDAAWPATYAALFPPIAGLAETFDGWHRQSVGGLSLRSTTERLIKSVLTDAFRSAMAQAKRAELLGLPVTPLGPSRLSGIWTLHDVEPDATLFPSGSTAVPAEREDAVNRLSLVFDRFYEGLLFVVGRAPAFQKETLDHPEHQPHMALFLAFLQVFQHARDHLNTLTGAHLDFYLKEVLKLAPRPEAPDSAHVVFELAKSFEQHRIEKGTPLRAGKDAKGADRFYVTESELVVHRARLDEIHGLKTVFVDKTESGEVRNVHAAPDADSADGLGADIEDAEGKWATFGGTRMPFARIGFAIASPMFLLMEGERHMNVTFRAMPADVLGKKKAAEVEEELLHNVKVYASGEKEWLPVTVCAVELSAVGEATVSYVHSVRFAMKLGPEMGSVVAYDDGALGDGFAAKDPVLKFVLDNEGLARTGLLDPSSFPVDYDDSTPSYPLGALVRYEGQVYQARLGISGAGFRPKNHSEMWQLIEPSYPYKYFQRLEILGLEMVVDVSGVRSLVLENDFGLLDAAKPFQPFGPVPKVGSRFLIGSREVFQKSVTRIDLHVEWADLPTSLKTHYRLYKNASSAPIVTGDGYFTAGFAVLEAGQWRSVQGSQALFTPLVPEKAPLCRHFQLTIAPSLLPDSKPREFRRFEAALRQGFLQARLDQSFLHDMYPGLLAKAAAPGGEAPNSPYTPLVASLTLGYEAVEDVDFTKKGRQDFETRAERIFQIGPFGNREIFPIADAPPAPGIPVERKLVQGFGVTVKALGGTLGTETAEGTLFIGVNGLSLPRNLSLLFQVAEGSEDPNQPSAPVVWSHLSDGEWVDFRPAEIISDSTSGLLTSGVIALALPKSMTGGDGLLPAGLHWIKASVHHGAAAVPKLVAVHPHAVAARYRNQGNDSGHLAQALPAGVITKLKSRDAAIKNVLQPYASFGGLPKESDDRFYVRASERLRHKRRAVTLFDYERLVLEKFPEVYKVKCIGHAAKSSEHAPGHVKLVVVPNLRNKNAVDPLRPQLSRNKLESIRDYLQGVASDFVRIEVANPDYEEVRVRFRVRLHRGRDEGFYTSVLEQDIVLFLSPWLHDAAADLTFGGRVHRSSILNYVERREYVDFVSEFAMDHIAGGRVLANVEEAVASSSSSALVAAKEHEVSTDLSSCQDVLKERRRCEGPVIAEPEAPPVTAGPPPPLPSGFRRYLGNTGSRELHDLQNRHPMCQIDEIAIDRQFYFGNTRDASKMGYDFCAYCFPEGLSKR